MKCTICNNNRNFRNFLEKEGIEYVKCQKCGLILRKTKVDDFILHSLSTTEEAFLAFSQGKGNVGNMPEFFHMQAMERVFAKCLACLSPTGTMTLITRDHREAGRRVHLTRKYIKAAERAGFKLSETFKRETPRTGFDTWNICKGLETVDDEDCLIFRVE